MPANRKISNFPASTSLPADAELSFVSGGVNYKITLANFLSALNVTGTIVQDGASSGTAILDKQGTVHNIRNLEDGAGISSEVSPENGITLAVNMANAATGIDLLADPAAEQLLLRSLVAGSGINIAVDGDTIQISAPGVTTASNVVIVNTMSDFPDPVAGVRTLADNTAYLISADLTTTDRFEWGRKSTLFGSGRYVGSLEYTGVGTMFTVANETANIFDMKVSAPNGTLFSVSCTGGGNVFILDDVEIGQCATLGSFSGMDGIRLQGVTLPSSYTVGGFSFTGNNPVVYINGMLAKVDLDDLFDLGTATFSSFSANFCNVTLASGAKFLKGAAASANINTNGLGSVTSCRFFGAGASDPLDTVSIDDGGWQFAENNVIPDTRPDGLLSVNGPLTVAISAANTPVRIGALAGDWVEERTSQFTADTAGRLTYDGDKNAVLPILANVAAEPVTGTNKDITFYISKNGTPITNSAAATTVSSGGPKNTAIPWQDDIESADYIELWVENNTDTTDIQINSGVLRIN